MAVQVLFCGLYLGVELVVVGLAVFELVVVGLVVVELAVARIA